MVGPHYNTKKRKVYIFFEFLTFLEALMQANRSLRLNLSVSIGSMMNEVCEIENLNIHQLHRAVHRTFTISESRIWISWAVHLDESLRWILSSSSTVNFNDLNAQTTVVSYEQAIVRFQSFYLENSHTISLVPEITNPYPLGGFRGHRRVKVGLTKFWTVQQIFADHRPLT